LKKKKTRKCEQKKEEIKKQKQGFDSTTETNYWSGKLPYNQNKQTNIN